MRRVADWPPHLRVVPITVRAAGLGTPFNEEVERLVQLVRIAALQGVKVCLLTEAGRMSHDPLTAATFCNYAKGLAITLDPSYYVYKVDRQQAGSDPALCASSAVAGHPARCLPGPRGTGGDRVRQVADPAWADSITIGHFCVDIKPQAGLDSAAELRKFRLAVGDSSLGLRRNGEKAGLPAVEKVASPSGFGGPLPGGLAARPVAKI